MCMVYVTSVYIISERLVVFGRSYGCRYATEPGSCINRKSAPDLLLLINLINNSFMTSHQSKAENADCVLLL